MPFLMASQLVVTMLLHRLYHRYKKRVEPFKWASYCRGFIALYLFHYTGNLLMSSLWCSESSFTCTLIAMAQVTVRYMQCQDIGDGIHVVVFAQGIVCDE